MKHLIECRKQRRRHRKWINAQLNTSLRQELALIARRLRLHGWLEVRYAAWGFVPHKVRWMDEGEWMEQCSRCGYVKVND